MLFNGMMFESLDTDTIEEICQEWLEYFIH